MSYQLVVFRLWWARMVIVGLPFTYGMLKNYKNTSQLLTQDYLNAKFIFKSMPARIICWQSLQTVWNQIKPNIMAGLTLFNSLMGVNFEKITRPQIIMKNCPSMLRVKSKNYKKISFCESALRFEYWMTSKWLLWSQTFLKGIQVILLCLKVSNFMTQEILQVLLYCRNHICIV